MIDRALALARTIPEDWRRQGLAAIAEHLVAADPSNRAQIDQALAVARAIPEDRQRGHVLVAIVRQLAAGDPPDPAQIDQALTVARTIPADEQRSEALAAIAQQLTVVDPARAAALIDEAMTLARSSVLDALSRWRLRQPDLSIALIIDFLKNCHDKTIAKSAGLAVLDVAVELSVEA